MINTRTKVTYNGQEIPNIINRHLFTQDDELFVFECDFIPEWDENGIMEGMEALNARNAPIKVTYLEKVILDMDPELNQAYHTRGSIVKKRDESIGLKQVYTFKCVGALPADQSLWATANDFYRNGLREYKVSTVYSISRIETVVFQGVYTVITNDTNTAFHQYQNPATGAEALANKWLQDHFPGLEFIRVAEEHDTTGQEKECTFVLEYLFRTLTPPAPGARLVGFTMDQIYDLETYMGKQVGVVEEGSKTKYANIDEGEKLGEEVPTYYAARAIFSIDKTIHDTPLKMKSLFNVFILNWIKEYIQSTQSIGDFHITKSVDTIDTTNWLIIADFLIIATSNGLVFYTVDETFEVDPNELWKKMQDGKHHTYKIWPGGVMTQKAVKIDVITLYAQPDEKYFENAIKLYIGNTGLTREVSDAWRIIAIGGNIEHRFRQEIKSEPYEIFYKSRTYTLRYAKAARAAEMAINVVDATIGRNLFKMGQ